MIRLAFFAGWVACGAVAAIAPSSGVTDIAIENTVIQPAVRKIGINLGTANYYDSGQMLKNLIARNPGFEGELYNSIVRCAAGAADRCVDENASSSWPAGFWDRATFEVFWGAARGRSGTVASYRAAGSGKGGVFTFTKSGRTLAAGDYLIVRQTIPGGATAGWWPVVKGGAAIDAETDDLAPGTSGRQAARLTAVGLNQSAVLSAYFDTIQDRSFLQLNGRYRLSFRAKPLGISSHGVQLSVVRLSSPARVYLSRVEALTPAPADRGWAWHTIDFTAAETGTAVGSVAVSFGTVGQEAFLLDDVSLAQIDGEAGNQTAFRDPVVAALRTFAPGVMRFWAGQLGDTLDNLIAGPFERQRAGFSAWSAQQEDLDYSLPEFLELCQAVGAEPWLVVPSTFSTREAATLIEYVAGDAATPYGQKRAAQGQSVPWTKVFAKIHLEFGNEAWNGMFKGGSIEYPAPYGDRAQTIFAAMRASTSYRSSSFDLVLGGQAVSPGRNAEIQNHCGNNDSFAVAPYLMNTIDSFSNSEQLFGSTLAEPEAFLAADGAAEGVAGGLMAMNRKALLASAHPVPLAVYETNLSPLGGTVTQAALAGYAASLGAGLAVADSMLQQMRGGVLLQNLFALPQYQFGRPDGSRVDLWGAVVDMGVTNRKRPQFLAVALANRAIGNGGAMLQTVHSGADPTWNQPLANTVRLNRAHDLQSFAFAHGAERSLIVLNLERATALPVTFSGPGAPHGTVQLEQLTAASVTDTNEAAEKCAIHTRALQLPGLSPLLLPPHSMTAILWKR